MDLRDTDCEDGKVDGTGSRTCPMTGFGIQY